jgi:hypothetical protein
MKGERQRHSSPDVLRSAYEEVLKAEATKAASQSQPASSSRREVWFALAIVAGILLASAGGLVWWLTYPAANPAGNVEASSSRRQLMTVVLEIEDYRRNTGHLPANLKALGLELPQIQFDLLPEQRYELRVSTGHHALVYRSGDSEPTAEH